MSRAIFTIFLQFQLAGVYSETTNGNETLFTRVSHQLSWIRAREACNNMSYAILPGMRAVRALGKMRAGEFAWIDGKEYTFCFAKNLHDTKETCRYVIVRREETNENLTYICNKDGQFEKNEEMLPYAEAENKCLKSSKYMQVVENFTLPMVVLVNRTDWIKDFNETSIINGLSPYQAVTLICIGIVKVDPTSFAFATTPCEESHTVICDATGINTALTLATRNKMIPRLGEIASTQRQDVDRRLISLVLIVLIIPVIIAIIAIIQYRKKKFIKSIAYHSNKYRKQGRSLCRETLPRDDLLRKDIESVNSFNIKRSKHDQSNNRGFYNANDPSLVSVQNPVHDNDSSNLQIPTGNNDSTVFHIPVNDDDTSDPQIPIYENNSSDLRQLHEHALLAKQASLCSKVKFSGSEKCAFTALDSQDSDKCSTMQWKKSKMTIEMYRNDDEQYENCNNVEVLI
ncbi:hypothetical protein CHS0354_031279 [Potamilus streckersoni]|uniref:C-type lectin domain-containing protein n=1 Tax=Potamilus streckersoni TaxID=2493646 RepID=A0AAE0TCE3_9BIVA|nr:hypothetical protein CHS0354_031279 [Potamilus streckersoni]